MSAVAAVLHLDGRPAREDLLRGMLACVVHRGTDRWGTWVEGGVGLGHRLRATTPEALREETPLVRGPCVLALDGRLDNRAELAALLGAPAGWSDGELVLEAYRRYGEGFVERLVGDFALVLWDGAERRLLAARDPMGQRPLYHCRVGDTLLLASEVRQLLCYPGVPCRLNEGRVALLLAASEGHPDETFYQEVYRVRAAHLLEASPRGLTARRYWEVDPARRVALSAEDGYVARFRGLFEEAVRSRLRSAGPVGVMVSGGLDSSAVACMALTLAQRGEAAPVRLFSALFQGLPKMEESRYVGDIAEMYGVPVQFVAGNDLWTLQAAEDATVTKDEPFLASYEALIRAIFRAARDAGVRVLLTGQGGDEVLMGAFWYLLDLVRERRLRRLREEVAYLTPANRRYLYRRLPRYLAPSFLHSLVRRLRGGGGLPPWLARDFARRVDLRRRQEALGLERRYRSYYLQGQWGVARTLGDTNWLLWAERVAQEYDLELRHPFMDTRLVDFLCRVPPEQKYRAGVRKLLLRRAMHGVLPESIRQRQDKANFHALFDLGMGEREAPRLERLLEAPLLARLGYVDRERLAAAFRRYQAGERRWRRELFLAFVAEEWLRERFEGVHDGGVVLAPPNAGERRGGNHYGEEAALHPATSA